MAFTIGEMKKLEKGAEKVNNITYQLVVYVSETGQPRIPEKKTILIPVFKGGDETARREKEEEEELIKLQWQGWDILGFCLRNPEGKIIAYE